MKANVHRRFLVIFCVLFLLSAACSLPAGPGSPAQPGVEETRSIETIEAMMTRIAGESTTATPGPDEATETPMPDEPTLRPSSTPQPTATKGTLPTLAPTTVCDQAAFLADITIPDGSVIPAGTTFTKTWRIKNIGSCTWTADYDLVFASGKSMGTPTEQSINATVLPGEYIDLSIKFKAPGEPGVFRSEWKLRNAAGVLFGLGAAKDPFYAEIKVVPAPAEGTSYDFTANVCLARWKGGSKDIPCIGQDGNANGFVLYQSRPILETGYVDDEPALLTNPPRVTNGVIRGVYPAYTVKTNDHFQAIVGCEHNAKNCDVVFRLDYQIDNGPIETLKSWHEAYEGQFTQANVNLSSLAGKKVKFILTVIAQGESNGDRAQWLMPNIKNIKPQPTATITRTPTKTPTRTPTRTRTPTLEPTFEATSGG